MLKYITPRIRFQEFDSWWEKIKLTDLGISVGGTAIESEFDPDGKYKVISIGSYSEESKYKDQGIRAIYSKKTEKRILEKDDLTMILNDKTSTGKIIGRVLLIDEDNSYVYNQRTQRICLNKNKYVPDFIFQLLNADINRNKIVRSAQGNTQIYVNWSDISNLDYLIPASLEEQSAIGSLFRTLDDLLASYKDNLANYQSLKETMLSKMFPKAGQTIPEIRLDGFEGEWKIKRADEIFKSVSEKNRALLPVLSASQIDGMVLRDEIGIDIKYDEATLNNYKVVKPGQFVIHLRSFQGGFALSKLEGITSPAYTIIDFIDKENHLPGFWNSILTSKEFIKRLETVTYGIRDGKSISFKDFSSLKFVFPNLEEQQAIGSYFSNLDNLINSYQEKISQLETLKKKLLQDMFV